MTFKFFYSVLLCLEETFSCLTFPLFRKIDLTLHTRRHRRPKHSTCQFNTGKQGWGILFKSLRNKNTKENQENKNNKTTKPNLLKVQSQPLSKEKCTLVCPVPDRASLSAPGILGISATFLDVTSEGSGHPVPSSLVSTHVDSLKM